MPTKYVTVKPTAIDERGYNQGGRPLTADETPEGVGAISPGQTFAAPLDWIAQRAHWHSLVIREAPPEGEPASVEEVEVRPDPEIPEASPDPIHELIDVLDAGPDAYDYERARSLKRTLGLTTSSLTKAEMHHELVEAVLEMSEVES